MKTLQATVVKGHLRLDEPTELPEGTVVELVPVNEEADESLSDSEWEVLRPLLERSCQSADERRGRPLADTIKHLTTRR